MIPKRLNEPMLGPALCARLRSCEGSLPSGVQDADWNMAPGRLTNVAGKILADVRSELEQAVRRAEEAERREQKLRATLDSVDHHQGQVAGTRHEYSTLPVPQEAELRVLVEQLETENRSLARIIQDMRTTVASKCREIGRLSDEISKQSHELQQVQLENFILRQAAQRSREAACGSGGSRAAEASQPCPTLKRTTEAKDSVIVEALSTRLAEENGSLRKLLHKKEAELFQRETELSLLRNAGGANDTATVSERQVISKLNSSLTETPVKLRQAEQTVEDIQVQREAKICALESGRHLPVHDAETQTTPENPPLYAFRQFCELQTQAASALSHDFQQRLAELEQEKSDKTIEFSRLIDAKDMQIGQLSADMAGALERHAIERRNLLGRVAAQEIQLRTQREKLDHLTGILAGSNSAKEEVSKLREHEREQHQQFRANIQHKVRTLEQQLQVKSEQLKETIQSLDVLQRLVRAASLGLPHSAASTQVSQAGTDMITPVLEIPAEFSDIFATPNSIPSSASDASNRIDTIPECETTLAASEPHSREELGCKREKHPETLALSERVCSLTAALLVQSHALGLAEARASDLQNECRELRARVYQASATHEDEEPKSHQSVNETFTRERLRALERTAENLRNENNLSMQKIQQLELGEAKLQDECKLLREERQTWKRRLDTIHQDHIARAGRERKDHEQLLETLKHHFDRLHLSATYDQDMTKQRRLGSSRDAEQPPWPACLDTASGGREQDKCIYTLSSDSCPRLIEAIQELTNVVAIVATKEPLVTSGASLDKAGCNHPSQNVLLGSSGDLGLDVRPTVQAKVPWSPAESGSCSSLGRTEVRTCTGSCAGSSTGDLRYPNAMDMEVPLGSVIHQLCELFLAVGRRLVTAERRASFAQLLGSLCYKQWQLQNVREAEGIRDRNLLRQQVHALQIQVRADEASQARLVARLCGLYQQRCCDLEEQREATLQDLRLHEARCAQLTRRVEKGKEQVVALQHRLSFLQASARERQLLAEASAEETAMRRLERYKKEIMESLLSQAGTVASATGADGGHIFGRWSPTDGDLVDRLADERRERVAIHMALKEAQRQHALSETRLEQARKQVTVIVELLRHVSKDHAVVLDGDLVESSEEGYCRASLSAVERKIPPGLPNLGPLQPPEQATTGLSGVAPIAQLRSEIATLREVAHQREMDNERQEVALSHSRVEANILRQRNEALTDEIRACLTQLDEAKLSLEEGALLRKRLKDVELWASRMNETHQAEITALRRTQKFRLQQLAAQNIEKTKERLRAAEEANRQLTEQNSGYEIAIKKLNLQLQRFKESTMRHLTLQTHFQSTLEAWLTGVPDVSNEPQASRLQPLQRWGPNAAPKGAPGKQMRPLNPPVGSRRQALRNLAPDQILKHGYVPLDAVRCVLQALIQVCVQLGAVEQSALEQKATPEPASIVSASSSGLFLEPLSNPSATAHLQAVLQGQRLVILCLYSSLVERLPELGNRPSAVGTTFSCSPLATPFSGFSSTGTSRLVSALDIPALLGVKNGGCARCSAADLARRAVCRLPIERRNLHAELELGAQRLQALLQLCLHNIVFARCAQGMLEDQIVALQNSPRCLGDQAAAPAESEAAGLGNTQREGFSSAHLWRTGSPRSAEHAADSLFALSRALSLLRLIHRAADEAVPALEKADAIAESLAGKLGILFSIPVTNPERRILPQSSCWTLPMCGPSRAAFRSHSCADEAPSGAPNPNFHRASAVVVQKEGVFSRPAPATTKLTPLHTLPPRAALTNPRRTWKTAATGRDLSVAHVSKKCGRSPDARSSAPRLAHCCGSPRRPPNSCELSRTTPNVFLSPRYGEEIHTARSTAACSVESLGTSSDSSASDCLSTRYCHDAPRERRFWPHGRSLSPPPRCEGLRAVPVALARRSPALRPSRLACRRSISMPPAVLSCSSTRHARCSCSLPVCDGVENRSPFSRRKLSHSPRALFAGDNRSGAGPITRPSFRCASCRRAEKRCSLPRTPSPTHLAPIKAPSWGSHRVDSLQRRLSPCSGDETRLWPLPVPASIVHLAPGRPTWLPPPLLASARSKIGSAVVRPNSSPCSSAGESARSPQRVARRQESVGSAEEPGTQPRSTPDWTRASVVAPLSQANAENTVFSARGQNAPAAGSREHSASATAPSCSFPHPQQRKLSTKNLSRACRSSSCTAAGPSNSRVVSAPGAEGLSIPCLPLRKRTALTGRPCGRPSPPAASEKAILAWTTSSGGANSSGALSSVQDAADL
ncbi:conserved hypothetical protein [Neospora caninum Liverpool]|nr:conserved hypothetical protein [Neospora caninum Liverpool]CBZ54311.1 conserved hypothetical protein [Neospora caninum Liverpool]|eukprot:XP_003884342.1 conserved hypothetical protein [Neospora caninum Liverpool]